MNITLLLPCRNEEGTIGFAIEQALLLPRVDEVIVIEGGSSDQTYLAAQKKKEKLEKISKEKVILLKQLGTGKWDAILTGIQASKNETISIWDADLTVSMQDQRQMHHRFLYLTTASKKEVLVSGNRLGNWDTKNMPIFNLFGNIFFSWLWNNLFRTNIPDLLCGSKIFSKKILKNLPLNLSNKDPFGDLAIYASALSCDLEYEFVQIAYLQRVYGHSNLLRWRTGLKFMRFVLLFIIFNFRNHFRGKWF